MAVAIVVAACLLLPSGASAAPKKSRPDTSPPTNVAIASPSAGATVSGTIAISAVASDNVAVKAVDMFVNGAFVASDATAPYTYQLDTTSLSEGPHSLFAYAYDAAGNGTYSATVTLTVDNVPDADTTPPTGVAITSPADGASVSGTVTVTATATDNVRVRTVDLRVDEKYLAYDNSAPYSYQLDTTTLTDGTHTLHAWAYDDAMNGTLSAPVTVTVKNASPPPPPPASGTSYYVDSLGGNDTNAGTSPTSAWKSLAKASSAPLAPGDTLSLKRESRWSGTLTVSRSGSAGAPITVSAYSTGVLPVITGASVCVRLDGSYVEVRDLHATGCSWAGFEISAAHVGVERVEASDNVVGVNTKSTATYTRIRYSNIHDNARMSVLTDGWALGYDCNASPKPKACDDDSGAFGIALHGDHAEVAFNDIRGHDTFSYDYGRDGAAVEIYGASYSHIHHNVTHGNHVFSELGKRSSDPLSTDNVYAYNTITGSAEEDRFLITRGAASGFGPIYNTVLINNSVHLTGAKSEGFICHAGCGTDLLTVRNNIISAARKVGYSDSVINESHNIYQGGILQLPGGMAASSLRGNAMFEDAPNWNLRLLAGSPAIDRGTSTGYSKDLDGRSLPLDGNGDGVAVTDIGAFEF